MNPSEILYNPGLHLDPAVRHGLEWVTLWIFAWWVILGFCVARVYARKAVNLTKTRGRLNVATRLAEGIALTAVGSSVTRLFFGILWGMWIITEPTDHAERSYVGQNVWVVIPWGLCVIAGYLNHLYAHWLELGRTLWIKYMSWFLGIGCVGSFCLGWLR